MPYHLDEYLPGLDLPLAVTDPVTPDLPAAGAWTRLGVLYQAVASVVAAAVASGERPVVLSGDCTTALGTVAGVQRAGVDAGIVWFDAHGDVQTLETTSSGYLGGLPLRLLLGYRPELIAARLGLRPVAERRTVLAGARDLDPPEVVYLADAQIRRSGVAELDATVLPDGPLYVHIDLDVIDPSVVPGLRYPAVGGPGTAAVASALGYLLGTGRVAAVGIACTWRPGCGAAARVAPALERALAAGG